jgi:hypothetical protein
VQQITDFKVTGSDFLEGKIKENKAVVQVAESQEAISLAGDNGIAVTPKKKENKKKREKSKKNKAEEDDQLEDLLQIKSPRAGRKSIVDKTEKHSEQNSAMLEGFLMQCIFNDMPKFLKGKVDILIADGADPATAFQSGGRALNNGGVLVLLCTNASQMYKDFQQVDETVFTFWNIITLAGVKHQFDSMNGVTSKSVHLLLFIRVPNGKLPENFPQCFAQSDIKMMSVVQMSAPTKTDKTKKNEAPFLTSEVTKKLFEWMKPLFGDKEVVIVDTFLGYATTFVGAIHNNFIWIGVSNKPNYSFKWLVALAKTNFEPGELEDWMENAKEQLDTMSPKKKIMEPEIVENDEEQSAEEEAEMAESSSEEEVPVLTPKKKEKRRAPPRKLDKSKAKNAKKN